MIKNSIVVQSSGILKTNRMGGGGASFKAVFASKKAAQIGEPKALLAPQPSAMPSLHSLVNKIVGDHEQVAKTVQAAMVRTKYTPEQLYGIQYKTGMLLMAEQMFCKTAELSANTFKNFTQMQV